ncbi:MAG: hypothetical protein ACJ76Z_14475 [Thermoleophilaceae bacterium]
MPSLGVAAVVGAADAIARPVGDTSMLDAVASPKVLSIARRRKHSESSTLPAQVALERQLRVALVLLGRRQSTSRWPVTYEEISALASVDGNDIYAGFGTVGVVDDLDAATDLSPSVVAVVLGESTSEVLTLSVSDGAGGVHLIGVAPDGRVHSERSISPLTLRAYPR